MCVAISRGGNELLIRNRTNTLRFGAINQTQVAIQEPKTEICMHGCRYRHLHLSSAVQSKQKRCVCDLSPPVFIPPPPAVISVYVLRVSGGNNRGANSPAHSSSCPHFKTSRRPSSIDPDLNPALLSHILRRAGLFITQHALGVDEGESARQGYTREECKE